MHQIRIALVCLLLVGAAACGGGSSPSSPSQTTPPPVTPANRPPVINSMNFAPTFGIAYLTQFSFNASASDPDGDSVSYAWDVAGNPVSGASGSMAFANGFTSNAKLTVTDSKGLTASDTRDFTVGSMTGVWTVTSGLLIGATYNLTQGATGLVSGSFVLPGIGNGNTDPAQPGRIDANGAVTMRIKVAPFTDFNMTGPMDTTGRRVTGNLQGSGFTGEPFTMVK